ncbi:MAG: hypothetical protein ABI761_20300 [Saprospiraceae bacterium]
MDYNINDLSSHLFWDVDKTKLEWKKNEIQIIEKVLIYGLLEDWKLINLVYGKEVIKNVSMNLRSLDEVTLSFLCTIYKLKKEDFRCYTERLSQTNFWT